MTGESITVGDRLPEAKVLTLADECVPEMVSTGDLFAGRSVLLVGVPGAFTPICSVDHLPAFISAADQIRQQGVDEIYCLAVNDPFVLAEWARQQDPDGHITMLADGNQDFTEALGLLENISALGMGPRCKRFALLAKDGVVEQLALDDPLSYDQSSPEKVLAWLKESD